MSRASGASESSIDSFWQTRQRNSAESARGRDSSAGSFSTSSGCTVRAGPPKAASRPPAIVALPFHWPDWRVNGASPARLAIRSPSRVPSSSGSAMRVRAVVGPTPGTGRGGPPFLATPSSRGRKRRSPRRFRPAPSRAQRPSERCSLCPLRYRVFNLIRTRANQVTRTRGKRRSQRTIIAPAAPADARSPSPLRRRQSEGAGR
jgi:hypothetical protein